MPIMVKGKTIQQEMDALGIELKHFNILYNQLKESQRLPSEDIIPLEQYTTIINYLRDKQVLGEEDKVQLEGIKIFDSRRRLENLLDFTILPNFRKEKNSGGIVQCRTYDDEHSGGILPCRY